MNNLFIIQLITSFLVGGGFIALISLVAERVDEKLSGIILAFPSTLALGFFFLAWTTSPQTIAEIAPATLIPIGAAAIFPVFYLYSALYFENFKITKFLKIIFSFIISILLWFLLIIPMVIFHFSNILVGLIVYFILATISHHLLHKKNGGERAPVFKYTTFQKIFRAIFVGFIIATVVFLGKMLNPFLGGVFSIFPAVFSSTFMIFHWYYKPINLFPLAKKIPLGSFSLVVYALTAMYAFPVVGFMWGTIISYCASLIISTSLTRIQKKC